MGGGGEAQGSEMTQQVKVLATKYDDLTCSSRNPHSRRKWSVAEVNSHLHT